MGERQVFQPLTREDRITVVLYRAGIVMSAAALSALAFLLMTATGERAGRAGLAAEIPAYFLQISVGMSVFFIHLYLRVFKKYLLNLYLLSLGCLAALLLIGKGSLSAALMQVPASALLLLPLSGCLGFVTAKEAFCFRLFEGYLLAMFLPLYLLLVASGNLAGRSAAAGLAAIAALLIFFTLRKVFMPLAFDIGDKTAYR